MAGTIITDKIESDGTYVSKIELASPVLVSNTFAVKSTGGTGNFNIVGANTNTDRTFTLPDNTGTLLTSVGGTLTGGLTMGGQLNLGSTGQIVFPATQNASANANTLDDYEEGTWTPSLTGINNIPGLGGSQKATYTKVGDVVTINLHLGASSVGVAAEFTFSLPFAMKTNSLGLSVFGFGFPYSFDWRGSATSTTTVRTFATGTSGAAQDISISFSYQTAT